jgi:hypothetical protein
MILELKNISNVEELTGNRTKCERAKSNVRWRRKRPDNVQKSLMCSEHGKTHNFCMVRVILVNFKFVKIKIIWR